MVVRVQQLSELEEIVEYKQDPKPETLTSLQVLWERRLKVVEV